MLLTHDNERLGNVIVFFARNTKHCHTLKLFKLLNSLDVEHYRQTGQPVTTLTYKALEHGPVPRQLLKDIKNRADYLAEYVNIFDVHDELTERLLLREIKPRKPFDDQYFSERELEIMGVLAEWFKEAKAATMEEYSHDKSLPWYKVYRKGTEQNMPFKLSLKTKPVIRDEPTITDEELNYIEQAFN